MHCLILTHGEYIDICKKVGLLCDNCFLPASQFTTTSNTIQYRLLNPVIISQLQSSHIVTIIEWCRVLAGLPTTLLQHYEHIAVQKKATLLQQLIIFSSFLELLHGRLQWATQAISEVHSIDTPDTFHKTSYWPLMEHFLRDYLWATTSLPGSLQCR